VKLVTSGEEDQQLPTEKDRADEACRKELFQSIYKSKES
jgi:hypothetical protein